MIKPHARESNRPRRVAELIKRELAVLIQRELHDPRVGQVTLTSVEVSRDFSHAKVYFTLMGGKGDSGKTRASLNRASGFLRHHLKRRVVLRTVPELRFIYDESVERGVSLSTLIDRAVAGNGDYHKD